MAVLVTVLATLVVAIGCGVVVLLAAPPVLRRLPEPALEPGEDKLPYAALSGWAFAGGCALLACLAVGIGWPLSPAPARPAWLVLGTVAVLLAAIDARTTWLPLPLTRVAWVLMGVAVAAAWLLGGAEAGLRMVVGAMVAGGLYLLAWLISRGGFGYGDVRFAPLVGSAAAAHSYSMLLWALVFGSLAGAVQGLIRLTRRRRTPYAYAPAILAGAYLALVASEVVRT